MLYVKDKKKDIYKVIGANVRYYRGLHNINNPEARISQEILAQACDVSTGLIGSLETGKVLGISVPTLYNIAQVLNVSVDQLLEKR